MLIACKVYLNNNEGKWPYNLQELIAEGSLNRRMVYEDPYHPGQIGEMRYYLYRRLPAGRSQANEVVISEPALHHNGAMFGFADGHVEWVESPRAEALLAIMRTVR
jgi:prepilin-type processing-associated H-X9-DG protein